MNAALYMRMSTDKQESSIDSQECALRAYAASRGINVAARYADEGVSGRTAAKRPAFMRMIEDSGGGAFDAVLVFDSSRFARNLEESIVYKSALRRNGVELISATEPTPDGDAALLTDAMLGALNEMHSRKLAAAVRRGMEYKAGQGLYQVPPPFGYKKSGKEIVIEETEAEAVRLAFGRVLECGSCHDAAQTLNRMGIFKRKGGPWQGRDIKRMISNPAYAGEIFYNDNIFPGRHEPIIDRQTWDAARRKLPQPRKKARPASARKHWLSGLIRCAYCGGPMSYVSGKNGRGSFRCSRYANGACPKSGYVGAEVMEKLAAAALRALAAGRAAESGAPDESGLMYVPDVKAGRGEARENDLQKGLKRLEDRLKRHKAAYSEGVDTLEEYRENKAQCGRAIEDVCRKIEEAKIAEQAKRENRTVIGLTDLIGLLSDENISVIEKNVAVRCIISEMIFDRDARQLKIYCK